MSKRTGHDLGETGCLRWIEEHAKEFRDLAESIPLECIGCGHCGQPCDGKECPMPLNRKRIRFLRTRKKVE
jgi:polyferredoxin